MFLCLEAPKGDKHVSIYAYDLAGDEDFEPFGGGFPNLDGERCAANRAIREVNDLLGEGPHKAFAMLFNQFTYKGVTGWEYWSDNYELVLKHAFLTAKALGIPLHVNEDAMPSVLLAASMAGWPINFAKAEPITATNTTEVDYVVRDFAAGKYFVLTDLVLPDGTPEVASI